MSRASLRQNSEYRFSGGIRDEATIEAYLGAGVTYCIIGTQAVKNPAFVKEACDAFPGHIIVGLDAKDFIETDPRYLRPAEVDLLVGDASWNAERKVATYAGGAPYAADGELTLHFGKIFARGTFLLELMFGRRDRLPPFNEADGLANRLHGKHIDPFDHRSLPR